jgi:DNA-binding LacI/PurR family transcriptional regulator
MKPTVKDIAAAANVSPATVSNALNNRKGVSEDIKQLVFKVAKEMGYSKEPIVERKIFRFVIFKRHGYVVSDTPFFSSLIEGIERQSRALGYELLISHINIRDEDYIDLVNSINNDNSSGIIILATEMLPEDLELFRNIRIPVVLLDSSFRENIYDCVLINNIDAAYKATSFLFENGHKRIGYLHSSVYINNFKFRRQGYLNAIQEHGLTADPRYELCLEPTMEGAYRDMKKLLDSGTLKLPSAFFSDNDIIAFGAMKAIAEKGIAIPGDVSIIGFDDMPFCEMTSPRLTTIKVYKQEIGSIAVKRLMQKISGNDNTIQKIEVGTELVIRDSHRRVE